jgi:hypothetical protein
MALFRGTGNPHHDKLPRDARHLISRLLAFGRTGYHRAGVLHAQIGALDYAVNRREKVNRPLPSDTDMHAPGQRVRLGADVRDLLARLAASRNLREQQALVREIRHAVLRRISIHMQRSRRLAAARKRAAQGLRWVKTRTAQGGRWVKERVTDARAREGQGPAVREPQTRTRRVSQARAARALTDGMRFSRDARTRDARTRDRV